MPDDALMRQVLKELESLRGNVNRGRKAEIPISLGSYLSDFLALPHLRGFWPGSSFYQGATLFDVTGQARHLASTGTTMQALLYNDLIPYLDFTAANNDYLTRSDEAGLDITGAITLGGWCWWDAAGIPGVTNRPFITKEPTTTYSPYQIYMEDAASQRVVARFSDSDAGTNIVTPVTTGAVSLSAWHCVIADCVPGGTARLTVDGVEYTASAAALASLYNSSGAFEIGRGFGTHLLDGRAAFCFLCANVLPANMKDVLWKRGKILFGV